MATGLRLYMLATDPGTGPIDPPSLPSFGVDDYAYRWEAGRITGTEGSGVNQWIDTKTGLTLSHATANKTLHNPGNLSTSYLEFAGSIAMALTTSGVDLGSAFSYFTLLKRTGSLENSFLRTDGYRSGVSGTTWYTAGAGNFSGNSFPSDAWVQQFSALDNTTPANSRTRTNANSTTNPGTLTGPHATNDADTVGFNRSGANAGALQVKCLVIWKRILTPTEWSTIASSAGGNRLA